MAEGKLNRRDFACFVASGALFTLAVDCAEAVARPNEETLFSFGVIADAQYCDADSAGTRYYRASTKKLAECVETFNRLDLAFVVHLGDFIDREFQSFDQLLPIFGRLQAPRYHVLGNHDFSVAADQLEEVALKLSMPARYYAFSTRGWRFVVLDGNDVSLYAHREGSREHEQAQALYEALKQQEAANAQTWNGAVGETQMAWLQRELDEADKAREKTIIFCHFPVYPGNAHNLWNSTQLVRTIESHRSVVAYMNGHNHAGDYGQKGNVHYVTFPGMVETEDTTAYAVVRVRGDGLMLQGYGRTPSRRLELRS